MEKDVGEFHDSPLWLEEAMQTFWPLQFAASRCKICQITVAWHICSGTGISGIPLSSSLFACKNQPISSSVPQLQKISATSPSSASSRTATRRRALSVFVLTTSFSGFTQQLSLDNSSTSWSKPTGQNFVELPNSGGVKALDLRLGDEAIPVDGDKVISGIESAVRSMKIGGIRRIVIPPSEGYQSTSQETIPPNFLDRQRLFTTICNPTYLANGEGSTLGTLIFDIELVSLRHW
ncbi:peptidyl-prolyl cis-trans isomerase FKBP17-1, chloroplastic-like [Coffea arabica]|uniref:peptidylprolyl isomerase n=1 Tax=Coffea arabica TaxID=13443 RepID=A0ABM4W8B9_COFAR